MRLAGQGGCATTLLWTLSPSTVEWDRRRWEKISSRLSLALTFYKFIIFFFLLGTSGPQPR